MMELIHDVHEALAFKRLCLSKESTLQDQMAKVFRDYPLEVKREYWLDQKNRVDFFCDGLAIECKIKGNRMQILRQVTKYCAFQEVKALILVTNRSMGFPSYLKGKPCFLIPLGRSWL